MKFSMKAALFVAALGLAFAACKKDSNSSSNNGKITCKIDGAAWEASGDLAGIVVQSGITSIAGKGADGTDLAITIQDEGTGTYLLAEGGDHAGAYSLGNGSPSFVSNQGSDATAKVTIASIDTKDSTMSGTFQFTGFRLIDGTQVAVTEGKFTDVKFSTTVNNTAAGSFKCKIDGVQFTAGLTFGAVQGQYLQVLGSSNAGTPSVALNLDPNIGVGTTNFDGAFGTNFGQYNKDNSTFLQSDSGKVTITKHDKSAKKIEGTFNFTASELLGAATANITEGSFSIKY